MSTKNQPLYRAKFCAITGKDDNGNDKLGRSVEIGAVWDRPRRNHGTFQTRRCIMPTSTCNCCGGVYQWSWEEAFDKFGFNDGEGQVETETVADVLRNAGFQTATEIWGLHNVVITSIKRDGRELIPYDKSDFSFGYDTIRDHLPTRIVELLDAKLSSCAT